MIPVASLVSQTLEIEVQQTLAPVLGFVIDSVRDMHHWALEVLAAVWEYFDSSSAAGRPCSLLTVVTVVECLSVLKMK